MAQPALVFFDANVLFSASVGGEVFALIWELGRAGRVVLCTSAYCVTEARANLIKKRPTQAGQLAALLRAVQVGPESPTHLAWAAEQVPGDVDDAPVLAAAVGAGAAVLVTGDRAHFGALMPPAGVRPSAMPMLVLTPRAFLLHGPDGFASREQLEAFRGLLTTARKRLG